jgi:gliding motility-associated-like protein
MPPLPFFSIGSDTALCPGDTLFLQAPAGLPGGTSLLWQNGADGSVFRASQPGWYTLRAHNGACDAADSLQIMSNPPPSVALPPDTVLCAGAGIILRAAHQNTRAFIWQNAETGPSLQIDRPGLYWVEARNGRCTARDSIKIGEMECPECRFYFPNAFAPERGGANAQFAVQTDCTQLLDYKLSVYDRWGDLVFYSNNPADAWDGVWRGQKAQPGAYRWFCRLTEMSATPKKRSFDGTILLVR